MDLRPVDSADEAAWEETTSAYRMPLSYMAQNSIRRYRPLSAVLACVAAGMVVDRLAAPRPAMWWMAAAVALAGWFVVEWFVKAGRLREAGTRRRIGSILTAVAAAAGGGVRHHAAWHEFSADDVSTYASAEPHPATIEGFLADAPRTDAVAGAFRRAGRRTPTAPSGSAATTLNYSAAPEKLRTRFTLSATLIRDGTGEHQVEGLVDVEIDGGRPTADAGHKVAEAGDRVTVVGRLAKRRPPMNPGEFDFAAHYRADRKPAVLRVDSADRLTVLKRGPWWNLGAQLSDRRRDAHRLLLANVPDDQAGFASALLLGYRDQLDAGDNRAYLRTGMVHILSISGMHVAMLALFLQCGLRIGWVARRTAALIIIGVTVAYGLLIDAEPPAVRALVVITAVGLSTIMGRRAQAFNVLAVSGLVVLAMNPNDLFRTGPQLSFLAAAVLAWWAEHPWRDDSNDTDDASDPLDQFDRGSLRRRMARHLATFGRGLLVSTAIMAITTPLVAHHFHVVSPAAIVLTPLVAIPMALGLFFGMMTLAAAIVIPPIAPWLGAVCGFSLRCIETLVVVGQDMPGASFWVPGPGVVATIGLYALVGVWALLPQGPRPAQTWLRRGVGAAALGWGIVSMIPHHGLPNDCRMRCTFIAVDHGLSVLVESRTADGARSTWLYDCGRLGSDDGAARSISGVLWSHGISRLDGIVISHADADHYNGLPALVELFGVNQIVMSQEMAASSNPAAASVREVAKSAGIPVTAVFESNVLPWHSASVECRVLLPPRGGVRGSDNANSIVVEVLVVPPADSGQTAKRLLLTGDLEGTGLDKLLARAPLDCDILLVPHHGSTASDPPGLAKWSRPELVVVSGTTDAGGVVRSAYERVGARVLETPHVGANTVTIDTTGGIEVETFR
jgi:competence protein ComEC